LGTAVYAAYSAMTHSRHRNLAIAVVTVSTFVAAAALGNQLPRFPGRLTAVFAILPAVAAGLGIRELRRRLADSTPPPRRAPPACAAPPPRRRPRRSGRWRPSGHGSRRNCTTWSRTTCR